MAAIIARVKIWGLTTWKDEHPTFSEEHMEYMKVVQHKAPDTDRLHWHSFIIFKSRLRMNTVKGIVADREAHCIPLYKVDTAYLDDGHTALAEPVEFGSIPKTDQGKRNDITRFKEALESHATLKEIAQEHFGCWLKYQKMIPIYRSLINEVSPSRYTLDQFKRPLPNWDTHWHLWGPPDTGKTQFALAHFTKPLYVRHIDHLLAFDNHDGIVFDEMSFTHWPITSVITLLNKKDQGQINIRYTYIIIPAGTRMIFCSNLEYIFYDPDKPITPECKESIEAKVTIVNVTHKLFYE